MVNIVFIAPPAAGKGTISKRLKDEFGYTHISTGDMLREAISKESEIGLLVKDVIAKGNFVSDDIMIKLIQEKINSLEGKPFILDGFPRTLPQAESLEELFASKDIDYRIIYLDIKEETAKERMLGRLTCECGKSYNTNNPKYRPKVDGICDECGKALVKRSDDNEEAFTIRYQAYLEKTNPILSYYEKQNKLVKIDDNRDTDAVLKDIINYLEEEK